MSISSETNRNDYTGNGAVDTYSYTFRIINQDDLLVTVKDTSNVETTLTITTDYTVTGVGDSSGGTVVLVNASQAWLDGGGDLLTGYTISIRRVVDIVQETDIRNQGDFFPETHEDAFDYLTFIDQQQQDALDRSVHLPESISSSDFDPTLPTTITNGSLAIVVNSGGTGFETGPTTSEISSAQTYANNASDSADEAEEWATKTDGIVESTDYSSKAWAVGGTGVTDTASRGASKEWAIETASTVDGTDYSAKEHAVGTQIRGAASGGSAKDWATYTGGTVDDTEYSAKHYASTAATSASEAATSAAASQWGDVVYVTNGDSPLTVVDGDAGTLYSVDTSGGAVTINLPTISGLTLAGPWSIGIKKTNSDANDITINRGGSDTIGGATSYTIDRQYEGASFIPDTDGSPDDWTTLSFGEVPITGDIVGTSDTQDLSNKTFTDTITLEEQSGTPSNPSSGDKKFYAKNDGKVYTLDSSGNEIEVGSGSGSGGQNYFDGGDFESGVDLATAYDDTGAYVDGSGGSPAGISVSANTTTPLVGVTDLDIAKAASDASGEGVTLLSETIDRADVGRKLYVQFEWDGTDANYTDGDLELKAYDVADTAILPVVPVSGLNEDGTFPASKTKILAYIVTNSSTTGTVRVSLHLESDSQTGSSWDCYVDDAKLSPDTPTPGVIITPWESFPPTGTWTTNTTYSGIKRRVGDTEEYEITVALSGAPTGTFSINIPGGKSINTSKVSSTTVAEAALGSASANDTGTDNTIGHVVYASSTSVNVVGRGGGANPSLWSATVPHTWANTDIVRINFKVPISGWDSGAAISSFESGLQTVRALYEITVSTANSSFADDAIEIVDFDNSIEDTHNTVTTGASWKFTAPRTGTYLISAFGEWANTTNLTQARGYIYKNGVEYIRPFIDGETNPRISVDIDTLGIKLDKDDYLDVRFYQDDSGSGARNISTDNGYISVIGLPDFTTFGIYGETGLTEASNGSFAAYGITADQWGDLDSISLPPGNYDISAQADFNNGGSITTSRIFIGISTTSGNSSTGLTQGDNSSATSVYVTTTNGRHSLSVPRYNVAPTSLTTYYIKARGETSVSNLQVSYKISARKIQ